MSTKFSELQEAVVEWAHEKGIMDKATPTKQALKTLEEVTELLQAIQDKNKEETIDALGDICVTIIIGAAMQGYNLEYCLESAYNVIKDRTGTIINGTFVKDK